MSRIMALAMTRIFLAMAMMATREALPRALRAAKKALVRWQWRMAAMAA